MSEVNDRGVPTLDEGSVLAGPRGGEDVDGEAGDNGKLVDAAASRRKAAVPNPEVSARPKRRHFSAAHKARIVEEAEGCTEPGEIGALLRREGLYSSQLSAWRKLYRAGALRALRDDKRGRKATKHPLEDENARLRKQNARLAGRLKQAETIIEIQKKVAAMLGIPLNSVEREEGE
jgi:transposase-like protein|tara:strand:+ start:123 stop:650 length:528 start_codon:yes stop_codon:yes gene_type:complete